MCIFVDDMRPTKEYIERKYEELNKLCFGGELPVVPIQMSRARTYLGQLGFKRRPRLGELRLRTPYQREDRPTGRRGD